MLTFPDNEFKMAEAMERCNRELKALFPLGVGVRLGSHEDPESKVKVVALQLYDEETWEGKEVLQQQCRVVSETEEVRYVLSELLESAAIEFKRQWRKRHESRSGVADRTAGQG